VVNDAVPLGPRGGQLLDAEVVNFFGSPADLVQLRYNGGGDASPPRCFV
jgi:hypothetical protein